MRLDVMLLLAQLTLALVMVSSAPTAAPATTVIAKPGCPDRCGNVSIPYPFGMKKGCYVDDEFLITCNYSFNPPKAFLTDTNIIVTKILLQGQLYVLQFVAHDCYDPVYNNAPWLTLPKFTLNSTENKFTAIGCDTYAIVQFFKGNQASTTGCMSICGSFDDVVDGSCSGVGCCQTSIPEGVRHIAVTLSSYYNHTKVLNFNPCSYAFVIRQGDFNFSAKLFRDLQNTEELPVVVDWAIGNETCEEAQKNLTSYACKNNSKCYVPYNGSGYRCDCLEGYSGNPYLTDGCQDIDECENSSLNQCTGMCVNTVGNYICSCPKGFHGDGRKDGQGCKDIDECQNSSLNNCTRKCVNTHGGYECSCPAGYHGDGIRGGQGCSWDQLLAIKVSVGIGTGLIVLLIGSSWLYWGRRKRNLIRLKEKFFEQNGGLMLQQQLSEREVSANMIKIFTEEELEKATSNYDESKIVGRGGYGTVFKGTLPDGKIVAVKKSKMVDQTEIGQFINEVVILSQINHRNVVKLLGCCLETPVPLLVYEFITNGTLFNHIHDEEKASALTWETRLKIATETAGVLSYLHSAASTPIIHRDIKSTNILLDDNCTAKVSDFGASRLVPHDETQISTMVQGTLGYLDPEYLLTSQLTEKSDVYSFGVVLAELLSGKGALCYHRPEEERNLAMYFLSSLKNDCLFQVIEDRIVHQGNTEQLKEVANLAKRCLSVKGEERPTMKEVAMELEGLRMMEKHPWVNIGSYSEETEHLLGEQSGIHSYGGSDQNATAAYDTIRDHVLISVGDGR